MALITAGAALCFAFPVLLLIFGGLFAWTARQGEMDPATQRVGVWLIGTGLLALTLYIVGGVTHLLSLCWVSVALTVFTAVLSGLFLRGSFKQPLRAVS